MQQKVIMCTYTYLPKNDYPEAVEGRCEKCDAKIWISQKKQKLKDDHLYPLLCIGCAVLWAKVTGEEPEIIDILKQ